MQDVAKTGRSVGPGDNLVVSGIGVIEEIKPSEETCSSEQDHHWLTQTELEEINESHDWYSRFGGELGEDEAVCPHCGAESTVESTIREKNLVVDTGAEKVTDYIAGNTVSNDFTVIAIGSTGAQSAPAEGDTALSNRVDTSPTLTPTTATTGGAQKKVTWSHTFPSGTNSKTSVNSMGVFDTTTTTSPVMLNRLTFSKRDNNNNDLKVVYKLTVS